MQRTALTPAQWAAVDKALIAGELSLRAIADDYGISDTALRKRIKTRGIVRSLGKKVAQRAEQKLAEAVGAGLDKAGRRALRDQILDATIPGFAAQSIAAVLETVQEQQIETVATAIAAIVGQHRAHVHEAQKLVVQLVVDLTVAAQHRVEVGTIIDAHLEQQAARTDPETGEVTRVKVNERRRASMHAAIGLPAHAKAAKQLVDALEKVQTLVRRAWGIADTPPPDPPKAADSSKMLEEVRQLAIAWTEQENAAAAAAQSHLRRANP